MLLKGDWEAAVWGLLGAREETVGQENADVCAARKLFSDGDLQGALRQMPRYMVAERAILEVCPFFCQTSSPSVVLHGG
jgi:tRNA(Glu) U13 pseudouridine synthase TruD